jgi:hypothetical protein
MSRTDIVRSVCFFPLLCGQYRKKWLDSIVSLGDQAHITASGHQIHRLPLALDISYPASIIHLLLLNNARVCYIENMHRIFVYVMILAVFGFLLLGSDLTPGWLDTSIVFYLFLVILIIGCSIGYELGIRAPTEIGSIQYLRTRRFYSYAERLRKVIRHTFSLGFSARRSKLDLRVKSPGNTQRGEVSRKIEEVDGNLKQ